MDKNPTKGGLLSVEEVAERLGIHRRTVYAYIKSGRLRAQRIGRGWMIHPDNLEAFMRGETGTPPTGEKGGLAPAFA